MKAVDKLKIVLHTKAPQHPAHGALHRAVADAVQEFLAGVSVFPAH
jgi:hypothetical protein